MPRWRKIHNTFASPSQMFDKMAYANSVDPDQAALRNNVQKFRTFTMPIMKLMSSVMFMSSTFLLDVKEEIQKKWINFSYYS